jgi:hypothetical protein
MAIAIATRPPLDDGNARLDARAHEQGDVQRDIAA